MRHCAKQPSGSQHCMRTPPAPGGRRSAAKELLALLAAGGVGAGLAQRDSRDFRASLGAGERTAVGELRRLALADGSDVWINTDSALDVEVGADVRRLRLYRGEIALRCSSDPQRGPFMIELPHGRLSAAAARSSLRCEDGKAALSVFDGSMRLALAGGAQRTIAAGKRMAFGADWAGALENADEMQVAWTRRRLSVERMRLDHFVADLGRYWRGHIACHPALAELLLTGSYPLDDVGRIFAALESTLPLRVRRIMPWWVSLEPAM